MKYEIVVIGDTNDADYVTAINTITEEDLELLKPLIAAIQAKTTANRRRPDSRHNWDVTDCADEDQTPTKLYPQFADVIELMNAYVPCSETGIHSLTSIYYYEKPKKIKLLTR